ncbi:MAG: DNA-directed RNA polymerase subunit beta [Deltaproteobacteria bacterium]|nr:DNA-directed RNA polymerase subunit beta [Deltaproteobacteria bacterium]
MKEMNGVRRRVRRNFGKIGKTIDIPNLIEVQKHSYERFLQKDIQPEDREDAGLQSPFKSVFPIQDFSGTSSLEFVKYSFEAAKYDEIECLSKGMTFEAPLRLTARLLVFDTDSENGTKSIRDIKEQEIYFGTIPMMTRRGTFIINGTERVIVSQLHRSPGVFFDHDKGKTHSSGKLLYSARIIPLRGSWLDFEFDPKDLLHVRIDRRRKFPATTFLKALGYTTRELLAEFYDTEMIHISAEGCFRDVNFENLYRKRLTKDVVSPKTKKVIAKAGDKYTKRLHKMFETAGIDKLPINIEDVEGRILIDDLIDAETGEILISRNQAITAENLEVLLEKGINQIECLVLDAPDVSPTIHDTMLLDKIDNADEAKLEIYRKMRPSSPPTQEVANNFFNNLFFNLASFDLSTVGRLKLNYRLNLEDVPNDLRTLRKEDIIIIVKELIRLKNSEASVDDIDNLGNRRVRAVGELLENQYRIGLVRMERAIKERMSLQEVETLMPHDLINSKPVSAVVKEFFGTSQLSQFMDQTNPLSEVTHKRRLSALGPGGLTRERAGFEVRDVHPTHYGRICPIETPEGPNIGLIVSLSTFARVNEYGFIETPYRHVENGKVTKEISYLSALDERDYPIAQANAPLNSKGEFINREAAVRIEGEAMKSPVDEIRYMDVSPDQLVSVSASLIPFLEHDDANRALMGSNMQRQGVPLLKAKAPLIGTGIEGVVAKDSGVTVVAQHDGVIEDVDSSRIVIRSTGSEEKEEEVEIHKLVKYQRSNQNTCYNQRPIVRKGDVVTKGQIIADGPATEMGELALGQNVMVAFMSWGGYNFEDSIIVSERVVKEDIYTSIHIEEFEVVSRDTKLGKEEITKDIPNVGEEALRNLDESGIVKIGAEVEVGDILVGKITPKGETQLSPEEKLLRAIFGDKAGDVKDTSLRVPPGVEGTVIDAKVFSRRGVEKDNRSLSIEKREIERLEKDRADEIEIVEKSVKRRLKELITGASLKTNLKDKKTGKTLLSTKKDITPEIIDELPVTAWSGADIKASMDLIDKMEAVIDKCNARVAHVNSIFEDKMEKLSMGDELAPGVIKMVKVYIAVKRKLSVGDKMAGRHGNKGVLSRILPVEDMPYFADGTPLDIILNPLGVPSRMNVGQVLEAHLGWASKELGKQIGQILDNDEGLDTLKKIMKNTYSSKEYNQFFKDLSDEDLVSTADLLKDGVHMASPVFDGVEEEEIQKCLERAGVPVTGQSVLYDGRTGEAFDQPVTVGVMYILKLHHLVDDKIHARSIGPYSLVTQQPLGGKAQFGGQRLGEMEVWAMEAYGAAYSLQEFLTVKSDDVAGRTRMYERIVKGNNILEAGLPESFKVMMKELLSLGLEFQLLEDITS